MKRISWEAAPHRTNRFDCFADTSQGRYMVRRTSDREKVFVLRLDGTEIGRYENMTQAKREAEKRLGITGEVA